MSFIHSAINAAVGAVGAISDAVGTATKIAKSAVFYNDAQSGSVSNYANINNTYSMCDIVCTIDIASNIGEHVVTTLGKLQTLSYSIYQQKQPVRVLGNMNAKDYVYGQRTIAGSLVFAVFNRHWLVDIYDQLIDKGMMKNWHYVADEIPPFNITISFANEYGYNSKMALYGVRLMTEGQVMSINDIYIENTYQFVATDIEYMDALNTWEKTDKIQQRFKSVGQIGNSNTPDKDPTLIGKTEEQKEEDKGLLVQLNELVDSTAKVINELLEPVTNALDYGTKTRNEALGEYRDKYYNQRNKIQNALRFIDPSRKDFIQMLEKKQDELDKTYQQGFNKIVEYYQTEELKKKQATFWETYKDVMKR